MCAQFESIKSITELAKYTDSTYECDIETLDKHIYPYKKAPVIVKNSNTKHIVLMRYSLIPSWSKTNRPKFATYNARLDRQNQINKNLELIYHAPTWKHPFKTQHCIVPLAGFYESCHFGTHQGNIVKFTSDSFEILLAAGIWDSWIDRSTGEIITSFAILTDEPTAFILDVGHDRQPVFLSQENAEIWLHNDLSAEENYDFLKARQLAVDYQVTNFKPLKGYP